MGRESQFNKAVLETRKGGALHKIPERHSSAVATAGESEEENRWEGRGEDDKCRLGRVREQSWGPLSGGGGLQGASVFTCSLCSTVRCSREGNRGDEVVGTLSYLDNFSKAKVSSK